jgi:hypothetical protein
LDDKTRVNDYGWTNTAIAPGESVDGGGWWHMNLTEVVQKYVSEGFNSRMFWFNVEEDAVLNSDFYYSLGPSAPDSMQPPLVVVWADKPAYDPVDFVVFSDNHENPTGVVRLKNTLGAGVGSFAIHNGDMNAGTTMDTTGLDSIMVDQFGASYPYFMTFGNHEWDADTADLQKMTDYIVGHHRTELAALSDFGGELVKLGTKSGSTTREYNRFKTFSFDVGAAHIVVWNPISIEGVRMKPAVAEWLQNDLELSQKPLKLVFVHNPIWNLPDIDTGTSTSTGSIANAKETWDLFDAAGVHAVISGHKHQQSAAKIGNMWQFTTSSTNDGDNQGFFKMSVTDRGAMTVEMYRGLQAEETWTQTQTKLVSPSRFVQWGDRHLRDRRRLCSRRQRGGHRFWIRSGTGHGRRLHRRYACLR